MIDIKFDVEGVTELSRRFNVLDAKIDDLTIPFEEAKDILKDGIDRSFDTNGESIDEDWAPLSPNYKKWKEKKAPGKTTLVFSGTMKESFDYEVSKTFLKISNSTDYFKFHQSREERKTLPRRPILKYGKTQKEDITAAFHKYTLEITKKK